MGIEARGVIPDRHASRRTLPCHLRRPRPQTPDIRPLGVKINFLSLKRHNQTTSKQLMAVVVQQRFQKNGERRRTLESMQLKQSLWLQVEPRQQHQQHGRHAARRRVFVHTTCKVRMPSLVMLKVSLYLSGVQRSKISFGFASLSGWEGWAWLTEASFGIRSPLQRGGTVY